MWEDDKNRLGGRWLINLNKNARNTDLDRIWLEIVSILFVYFFTYLLVYLFVCVFFVYLIVYLSTQAGALEGIKQTWTWGTKTYPHGISPKHLFTDLLKMDSLLGQRVCGGRFHLRS